MKTEISTPEDCKLVAIIDGRGDTAQWILCVEDSGGGVIAYLKWPAAWSDKVSGQEILRCGFEVRVA